MKNYLFKSLRSVLFKKLSKRSLFVSDEQTLEFHFELSVDEKLAKNEELGMIKKEVDKALEKLTSRQREIIYYRFYMNLGFDEIADIMGMQVRATYKLTARALDTMRQAIPAEKFFTFLLFISSCHYSLQKYFCNGGAL